ncbi:hypothetical protein FB446DRAFT_791761 [Lentinula raphanica]|nr:hypothetical protein FB446DRAFT_791761 [Lentinula raphanica]
MAHNFFGLFSMLYVDFLGLHNLRRTCHTANIYVSAFQQRAYSIHRILSAYFTRDEVDSFRNLQAVIGMVISGSSALQFFNREVYDTNDHRSDLDTYCVLSKGDAVGDWLLSHNYEYQPQRNQLPCFADDWKKTQESKSTSIETNLCCPASYPFDQKIQR